ncbi:phage major capsid protein, P2 family [Salmonella enterica]|nr:phage major capsid protein, P2 family [Salmonella enterica]EEA2271413.1 phage major capsid protein, P2 family [Salmonella enterica]EFV5114818.1 phage major capsid protein, P2 family [Salmonella enterica]EGB7057518.1 phage major capsid protein, P2 family [Salmonella enterica]EGO6390925.1 phage major capsid protein, P2 family [Salmonella enterica]
MQNKTRDMLEGYIQQQARLNNVSTAHVTQGFTITPSVEQTLENKKQQSADLLQKINVAPVSLQTGQKLGLGVTGPVSSVNTSTTTRRTPTDVSTLDENDYSCQQVNVDTFIPYAKLDMWAEFPDFQQRLTNQIIQRQALDTIMIGFNGVKRSNPSDPAANPLLQDCGVGWLERIRQTAPQRVMSDVTISSLNADGTITAGTYGTVDAAVNDAKNSLLDPWYQRSAELVVLCSTTLVSARELAALNFLSANNPNSEALAGQLIAARQSIASLPTYLAPYIPDGCILITPFQNLSVYWQKGTHRRRVADEPQYNRVATYESVNYDYVIEDFGAACLLDGLAYATAADPTGE